MSSRPSHAKPLSVLLLCDDDRGHANTILDQLAAIRALSAHKIFLFNPLGLAGSRFLDLDDFDVLVIHYSIAIVSHRHLAPGFYERIRRFQGLKVQLIQDDYRWVDDITAIMRHLGIHVLFTLVPEAEIPKIWNDSRLPGVEKFTYLAGYVPDSLLAKKTPAFGDRPLDVGYRGRVLPYWLGWIGQEKVWIAQGFLDRATKAGLLCDVAWKESDRIYGGRWVDFIASCKATLGTESGATITDFDGSVERAVKQYVAEHPHADFFEVHHEVLAPFEGNVRMNVISPRVFEAVALRTGLILFPGEYSGVVRPWDHYIPLAKDFGNFGEVVASLRDAKTMQQRIERAYEEIAKSERYSLRGFIRSFDDVLWQRGARRARRASAAFPLALVERRFRLGPLPGLARLARMLLRGWLAAGFTLRDQTLRACLAAYVTDGELRQSAPASDLLSDLLRLGLLRRVVRGTLPTPTAFRIWRSFDAAGAQLAFVSRGVDDEGLDVRGTRPTPLERGAVEALRQSLADGTLGGIVWNHSTVGRGIAYPWRRGRFTSISLGDEGIYRFRAIEAIGKCFPERVAAALLPLLTERQLD